MTSNETEHPVDTKLRAGSRYFLNRQLDPPQAIEIYYSNPKLVIRSGPAESKLQVLEQIDAGYRYGYLDGRPNMHEDYQQASQTYKAKIEDALANGYVEVEQEALYPITIQSVRNKLVAQHLLRPYWLPIVIGEHTEKWFQSSHYGGASYFKDQVYPTCDNCQNPLGHLLQLDLSELPENYDFPIREGLVKIFYCVDEDCELFDPKQNMIPSNYFCVYVPPEAIENIVEFPDIQVGPSYGEPFYPWQISGWDYGGEEFPDEEYLSNFMDHVLSGFTETEKYAYTFFVTPYHSDKLGGWPQSAGFDEIAICKVCSEPMTHVYHINPNAYVEYSPAAVIGRVFICPKHMEEIFLHITISNYKKAFMRLACMESRIQTDIKNLANAARSCGLRRISGLLAGQAEVKT